MARKKTNREGHPSLNGGDAEVVDLEASGRRARRAIVTDENKASKAAVNKAWGKMSHEERHAMLTERKAAVKAIEDLKTSEAARELAEAEVARLEDERVTLSDELQKLQIFRDTAQKSIESKAQELFEEKLEEYEEKYEEKLENAIEAAQAKWEKDHKRSKDLHTKRGEELEKLKNEHDELTTMFADLAKKFAGQAEDLVKLGELQATATQLEEQLTTANAEIERLKGLVAEGEKIAVKFTQAIRDKGQLQGALDASERQAGAQLSEIERLKDEADKASVKLDAEIETELLSLREQVQSLTNELEEMVLERKSSADEREKSESALRAQTDQLNERITELEGTLDANALKREQLSIEKQQLEAKLREVQNNLDNTNLRFKGVERIVTRQSSQIVQLRK